MKTLKLLVLGCAAVTMALPAAYAANKKAVTSTQKNAQNNSTAKNKAHSSTTKNAAHNSTAKNKRNSSR